MPRYTTGADRQLHAVGGRVTRLRGRRRRHRIADTPRVTTRRAANRIDDGDSHADDGYGRGVIYGATTAAADGIDDGGCTDDWIEIRERRRTPVDDSA